MNYYWINQSEFEKALKNGFIRADLSTGNHARKRILEVKKGDVLFSFSKIKGNPCLRAVLVALEEPVLKKKICKIDCRYTLLEQPYDFDFILNELEPYFSTEFSGKKYSPIDKNKNRCQGYIYPLARSAALHLIGIIGFSNKIVSTDRQKLGIDKAQALFSEIRKKMEKVGFKFEKEQQPHFQAKRLSELKFTHPLLEEKFDEVGEVNRAKKFYLKQLSDDDITEIGITTGTSSPLFKLKDFPAPNAIDTFKNNKNNAWSNKLGDNSLDNLLNAIENYLLSGNEELGFVEGERFLSIHNKIDRNIDLRHEKIISFRKEHGYLFCEICKFRADLELPEKYSDRMYEVHHKIPLATLDGPELKRIGDLAVLCANCHKAVHVNYDVSRNFDELRKIYKRKK